MVRYTVSTVLQHHSPDMVVYSTYMLRGKELVRSIADCSCLAVYFVFEMVEFLGVILGDLVGIDLLGFLQSDVLFGNVKHPHYDRRIHGSMRMVVAAVLGLVLVGTGSVDGLEEVVLVHLGQVLENGLRCGHDGLAGDVGQEEPEKESGSMVTVAVKVSRIIISACINCVVFKAWTYVLTLMSCLMP